MIILPENNKYPKKDFAEFIANGNYKLDEHWQPVVSLCQACEANFQFIGHSEHFQEDLEVGITEVVMK